MTRVHKLRLAAFVMAVLTVLAAILGRPPRRVRPAPRSQVIPGPEAEAGPRPGEFRRKNPFGIQRVRPPVAPSPAPEAAARPPPPRSAPPPPTLPLKLVGTIDAGRYAMAFFTGAGPRQLALQVAADLGESLGERFRGLVLAEIHRGKAVFRGQGREVVLELDHGELPGASPEAPSSPVAAAPASAATPEGEVAEVTLQASEVQRSLSNLAYLVTQASAQPFFDKGVPAGIRISRIRPGSVPDKLGLRNGDVIRGVDGNPIRTLPDAVKLLKTFQAGGDLRLEVLRGGRPKAIQYRIR